MPLIHNENINSGTKLGLWRITEDRDQLIDIIGHLSDIPIIENKRSLQWMAARSAILELVGDPNLNIIKDDFGKPHILNSNNRISITHCGDYAAAIISDSGEVGIDLEKVSDRINRVGHKFASESEKNLFNSVGEITGLHIIWGVKESLYKLYGRKEIDFRANLEIQDFNNNESEILASINKGPFSAQIKLRYKMINDLLLVYTLESI